MLDFCKPQYLEAHKGAIPDWDRSPHSLCANQKVRDSPSITGKQGCKARRISVFSDTDGPTQHFDTSYCRMVTFDAIRFLLHPAVPSRSYSM